MFEIWRRIVVKHKISLGALIEDTNLRNPAETVRFKPLKRIKKVAQFQIFPLQETNNLN